MIDPRNLSSFLRGFFFLIRHLLFAHTSGVFYARRYTSETNDGASKSIRGVDVRHKVGAHIEKAHPYSGALFFGLDLAHAAAVSDWISRGSKILSEERE